MVPVDGEIRAARDVFGLYLGHWQPRRPDRLNTDEHPRVEFLTPVSHRDRTLLHGDALRRYYDDVFARLPDPLLGHSRGTGAGRAPARPVPAVARCRAASAYCHIPNRTATRV